MPLLPCRAFCLALLLLYLTVGTHAQTTSPAPSTAYHWHAIILQHAAPNNLLSVMHWDGSRQLPDGVRYIQAFPNSNSLLLEATDEGFTEFKRLIRILDIGRSGLALTMLSLAVPVKEAGLNWSVPLYYHIEMQSSPQTARAFARLVKAGYVPVTAKALNSETNSLGPEMYELPGYRLSQPRLYSDNSLTFNIDFQNLPPELDFGQLPLLIQQMPHLQRGNVLAIKLLHSPTVMLIKVDY